MKPLRAYLFQIKQRIAKQRPLLPLLMCGIVLIAFGVELLVDHVFALAANANWWHGVFLFLGSMAIIVGGKTVMRVWTFQPDSQQKPSEPSDKKEAAAKPLAFPFDVLAGHHCAVVVTFGSASPRTYLIPNVGRVVGETKDLGTPMAYEVMEKTVSQLRQKGFRLQVLKPKLMSASWYTPLMGNPQRDMIRVQPFDMTFVNWN